MMKALKVGLVSVATASALVGGLALGSAIGGAVAAADSKVSYPVNENGLTFGSAMDADAWNRPDLILANGTNEAGEMVEGYLLKTDLEGPTATMTPQEAARWQEAQGDADIVIPLYDESGKTVIGTFVLTGGGVTYTVDH